jgi:hypothetical protein
VISSAPEAKAISVPIEKKKKDGTQIINNTAQKTKDLAKRSILKVKN